MLDLEAERAVAAGAAKPAAAWRRVQPVNPWRVAAWTSLAWMAVLGITVVSFLSVLERQDRKLELLLERTAPSAVKQTSLLMAP